MSRSVATHRGCRSEASRIDNFCSMPPTDAANTAVADTKVRCSEAVKYVLQTVIQTAVAVVKEKNPWPSALRPMETRLAAQNLDWRSSPGSIIEVLLRCVGLDWSRSGQTVWRVADPTSKLLFRAPEKSGSLRPAAARPTTIGSLDTAELEHDAVAGGAGSEASQRAAARARPEPPRVLECVAPDAADRLKRGTGCSSAGWATTQYPATKKRWPTTWEPTADMTDVAVKEFTSEHGGPRQAPRFDRDRPTPSLDARPAQGLNLS